MTIIAAPSPTQAALLLGLPVEIVALLVAGLGLIASLAALTWQFTKHILDGGRVKVYLNPGVWEPGFAIRINRSGKFAMREESLYPVTRNNFEIAQLVVENPGRTAITIYSPGLALTGTGYKAHSLTPRSFDVNDLSADSPSNESAVRLEPYDRVSFTYDFWSVVPSLLEKAGPRGIAIRGFVSVAGRTKRPQKSSWRRRWRMQEGDFTALDGPPKIAPFTILWRELYRRFPEPEELGDQQPSLTKGMLKYVLERAMRKFDSAPDRETFQKAMEYEGKKVGDRFGLVTIGLWEGYAELERLKEHLGPWNWQFGATLPDDAESDPTAQTARDVVVAREEPEQPNDVDPSGMFPTRNHPNPPHEDEDGR
ncbi:hypothetical protein ABRP18_011820 [Microbacterium sp. WHRI 7836]|uniref:hypothetical protein n=1 Tax=Microbacterium sp. WHRI 7836 TaxID=3162563 RepID=UPI0032ECA0C2